MALGEVGNGSQVASITADNADSVNVAFPANVASGSLLLAMGASWQSGSGNTSIPVTDTRSTSYTTKLASTGVSWSTGVGKQFIAYGVSSSGGANTVTINPSGTGNYIEAAVDEFSGPHATPLDVDGGESTGTSTTPSDGLTATADGDILIGVMAAVGAAVFTNSGHDILIYEAESAARQPMAIALRFLGDDAAQTMSWTQSVNQGWSAITAAFKPTLSSAGPVGVVTG